VYLGSVACLICTCSTVVTWQTSSFPGLPSTTQCCLLKFRDSLYQWLIQSQMLGLLKRQCGT
jgi:hypothetical protein